MASCSNDDFVGEKGLTDGSNNQQAIAFSTGVPAVTRADATGAEAAEMLHKTFYVYGIKNEQDNLGGASNNHNLVFPNYKVVWEGNTDYTTTTNTNNWEYAGKVMTPLERNKIVANDGIWNIGDDPNKPQTVKYWDWGASDYTFYAFSALPSDLENGNFDLIRKEAYVEGNGVTVLDKGYHIEIHEGKQIKLDELYFSDRVSLKKSDYGRPVTFKFHKLECKVRAAMYETIPGYSVTIDGFKIYDIEHYTWDPNTDSENDRNNVKFYDDHFVANYNCHRPDSYGKMEIRYDENGSLRACGTNYLDPNYILELGNNLKKGTVIGESAATATYDKADGSYQAMFPQRAEENFLPLRMLVSYTLKSDATDKSDDVIKVKDAEVRVPAKFLSWNPGCAYTYIFKISDNTSGYTYNSNPIWPDNKGTNHAGLYPITFDAVVTENEDGKQETITTISEPSITIFGYKENKYYVTNGGTYKSWTDVYAVITDAAGSVITLDLGTNVKVYEVHSTNDTEYPVTEASVADAIANHPTEGVQVEDITNDNTHNYLFRTPEVVTEIPTVDGSTKDIKALKMTRLANGRIYAIEYNPGDGTKTYEIFKAVD